MVTNITLAALVQRFLPGKTPADLDRRLVFRLEQALELHEKAVDDSYHTLIEQARQILWPLICEAGGTHGDTRL